MEGGGTSEWQVASLRGDHEEPSITRDFLYWLSCGVCLRVTGEISCVGQLF